MKILLAAGEAVPYCTTGGLGDVVSALAIALKKNRHDVRIVLPKYRAVSEEVHRLKPLNLRLTLPLGDGYETASLWETRLARDIPVYFIDAPKYFDRDGLYLDEKGSNFPDNDERFIVFSRGVLETAKALDFRPDVIHCHDWQTGLVPAYLQTVYRIDSFFIPTATVFTIHNIAYQGLFPKNTLFLAGFSWADFTPTRLEFYGQVNFLKAGLVFAHILNTVSPTYSREVQSGPVHGCGMEGILKARAGDFFGVLNGIDMREWDPAKDGHIVQKYSAKTPARRAPCKADLQSFCGLEADPRAPLIGIVSRLDALKGHDMTLGTIEEFLEDGCQLSVLGQGDKSLEESFRNLAGRFPGRAAYCSDFNETLAHKIYAGSDIFLMPSRFEPCGLSQLIAMRYGSVPVVTPTGGLLDTVSPFDESHKDGVGFVAAGLDTVSVRSALRQAVSLYRGEPAVWRALMARAMSSSFGWSESVEKYLELFRLALSRKKAE
jgi:starch synthase